MRKLLFVALLVVLSGGALAQDWQNDEDQLAIDRLVLVNADGTRKTTGRARAFIALADTSLAANQCNLVLDYDGTDTTWVAPDTMANGVARRDSRYDIFSIDGIDVQIEDNIHIPGSLSAKSSVDGTAVKNGTLTGADAQDSTFTGSDLDGNTIGEANYGDNSIPHRALQSDIVEGTNLSTTITKTDCRMRIRSILSDSSAVGDASHAGYAWFYDGFGHRVEALPSASMAADAAWYWPVATGSTNGIYQKTASGAQITLSATGLTALGATTVSGTNGAFTKLDVSGVSGADTSGVKNQLRVGKKFIVGGWGNIGKTYFQRDGLEWSFGPSTLAGSGATLMVHGSANTGDLASYSVAGGTETITPTSDPVVTTLSSTGTINSGGNLGVGTNAAAALLRMRDGSNNHIDLKAPSLAANFVVSLPATWGLGTTLRVSAVSDSNVTLSSVKDVWTSVTTASATKLIFNVYAPGVTSDYLVTATYNVGAGSAIPTARLNGYAVTDSLGVSCSVNPGTGKKIALHASPPTP